MSDKCSKCGSKNCRTEYHKAKREDELRNWWCKRGFSDTHNDRNDEHLHLYCVNCGWDWCKDVKGKP